MEVKVPDIGDFKDVPVISILVAVGDEVAEEQPLIELVPDMARYVAPGGRAILSGILTTQANEVAAAYAEAGMPLSARDDLGDWTTLVVQRA